MLGLLLVPATFHGLHTNRMHSESFDSLGSCSFCSLVEIRASEVRPTARLCAGARLSLRQGISASPVLDSFDMFLSIDTILFSSAKRRPMRNSKRKRKQNCHSSKGGNSKIVRLVILQFSEIPRNPPTSGLT